jgi:hypothetical protein
MPVVPSQTDVGNDAAHLAGDDPQHAQPLGDLDAHQLLGASARPTLLAIGRQVVGPVGQRDDLIVVTDTPSFSNPECR